MSCVICLDKCSTYIDLYRQEESECKCKYKIHFECLEYYVRDKVECLMCKRTIFYNMDEDPGETPDDIPAENPTEFISLVIPEEVTTNMNNEEITNRYNLNDVCEKYNRLLGMLLIVIILLLFLPF